MTDRSASMPRTRCRCFMSIRGNGGVAAVRAPQSSAGAACGSCGIDVFGSFRKASQRHVVVDAFVLACAYQEGLVPDADVAVRADFLVELHPVWVVGLIAVARIRGQVLKRSPVLHIRREA